MQKLPGKVVFIVRQDASMLAHDLPNGHSLLGSLVREHQPDLAVISACGKNH